jgi:hypothetical protein
VHAGGLPGVLDVLDRVREDLLGRSGRDRLEVVEQRLSGRLAHEAEGRHEQKQRREDPEDAVVGERRGLVGQVVVP